MSSKVTVVERDVYDAGARENYRAFSEGGFLIGISETAGLMDREIGLCQRMYAYAHSIPGQAACQFIRAGEAMRRMYDCYCSAMYQPDSEEKSEIRDYMKRMLIRVDKAEMILGKMNSTKSEVETLLEECRNTAKRIRGTADALDVALDNEVMPRCLVNHSWEVTRATEGACLLTRMKGLFTDIRQEAGDDVKEPMKAAEASVKKAIKEIDIEMQGPEKRAEQMHELSDKVWAPLFTFIKKASTESKSNSMSVSLHELMDAGNAFRTYSDIMKDSVIGGAL